MGEKEANNDVHLINFLDSSEALQAKKEAENNETKSFSSVKEFINWVNKLDVN